MQTNEKNTRRNGKSLGDKNETLLNALEKRIVYLVVNKPSISLSLLAKELDLDRRTVEKLLNKETVKIAVANFQKDCDQLLMESLTRAAQVVRGALHSEDEKIKTRIAVDLLKGLGKFRNYNDNTYMD